MFYEAINEAFSKPVEYYLDKDKSGSFHKYYLFQVNGNNYRVNIARISSPAKTAYMFTLGSLSDKGSMVQFKFRSSDIYVVLSTAIKIFHEWHESNKNLFTSIIFKLPDKITFPQTKIVENIIKRRKIQGLEKIKMNGIMDAKHKYLFYKNTKKPQDEVLKGLMWQGFNDYGFKDAFPAELLDSILLKTKVAKTHLLDQVYQMSKNFDAEELNVAVFSKVSSQELKIIEQKEDEVIKITQEDNKVEETEEAKENKPTPEEMRFYWPDLSTKRKAIILNDFIGKVDKIQNGLNDLIDYVSKRPEDDVYENLSMFVDSFEKYVDGFKAVGNVPEMNKAMLNAFFSIPVDYIRYLEFHLNNSKQFSDYTPYIFFVNKKLATDKNEDVQIIDNDNELFSEPILNGFYTRLLNNVRKEQLAGQMKYEGVDLKYFMSLMQEEWDLDKKVRKHLINNIPHDIDIIMNNVNNENYFQKGKLEIKTEKVLLNAEVIVLEYIDLKGIEEPSPVNNIFDGENLSKTVNYYHSIQKKNADDNIDSILSYTGSGYTYLNGGFRDADIAKSRQKDLLQFLEQYKKNSVKLSEDIEVSRKTSYPSSFELDKTYIDYSPLSTSLSSSVWSGSNYLRIRIPKGNMVFFALKGFSNNSQEKEVILPPGSIIKPYRRTALKGTGQEWIECIVLGNVFNHVYSTIELINEPKSTSDLFDIEENKFFKSISNSLNEERKKEELTKEEQIELDTPFKDSDKIMELIKKGKIKPDYNFDLKET